MEYIKKLLGTILLFAKLNGTDIFIGILTAILSTVIIGLMKFAYNKYVKRFFVNYYDFIMSNNFIPVNEVNNSDIFIIPKRNFELYPDGYDETPIQNIIYDVWGKENDRQHILIEAEGGMGKTVTLLKLYKKLNKKKGVLVVYIPLYQLIHIDKILSIEDFISKSVFNEDNIIYKCFIGSIKKYRKKLKKPRLVILLDGFNEIAVDKQDSVADNIKSWLKYKKVQLIITTRGETLSGYGIRHCFLKLNIRKLTKLQIKDYLCECRLDYPEYNEQLLNLLGNPLMLTLYAHTESFYRRYSVGEIYKNLKISKWKEPCNTAGTIIWNYFQCQIIKFFDIGKGQQEKLDIIIAIEYLLPYICFKMIEEELMEFDHKFFTDIIESATPYFERLWESKKPDRVSFAESALNCKYRFKKIGDLLVNDVHLLNVTDNNKHIYTLYHQTFRDCSAAMHLINNMEAYINLDVMFHLWNKKEFTDYLIDFIADFISLDEMYRVYKYIKDDNTKKTALINIISVMKVKLKYDLSEIDFSDLDLTFIDLKNCTFSKDGKFAKFNNCTISEQTFVPCTYFLKAKKIIVYERRYIIISVDGATRFLDSSLVCKYSIFISPQFIDAGIINNKIFYYYNELGIYFIDVSNGNLLFELEERIREFIVSNDGIGYIKLNYWKDIWINFNKVRFNTSNSLEKMRILDRDMVKPKLIACSNKNWVIVSDNYSDDETKEYISIYNFIDGHPHLKERCSTAICTLKIMCLPSKKEILVYSKNSHINFYCYELKELEDLKNSYKYFKEANKLNLFFSENSRFVVSYSKQTLQLYNSNYLRNEIYEMESDIRDVIFIDNICYCLLDNSDVYKIENRRKILFLKNVELFMYNKEMNRIIISDIVGSIEILKKNKDRIAYLESKSFTISFVSVYESYCMALSSRGSIVVWDLNNGQLIFEFEHPEACIINFTISKITSKCIIVLDNGIVQLWDFREITNPKIIKRKLFRYNEPIILLDFVPLVTSKDLYLVAFKGGSIKCVNIIDGYEEKEFKGIHNQIIESKFIDSSTFYCRGLNEIYLYNFINPDLLPERKTLRLYEAITYFNAEIYVTSVNGEVKIYYYGQKTEISKTFSEGGKAFLSKHKLVCSNNNGDLCIFYLGGRQQPDYIESPDEILYGDGILIKKILPIENRICVCITEKGNIKIWNISKNTFYFGNAIHKLLVKNCTFYNCKFESVDIKNLIIGGGGKL